ncbi:MAG: hypothetical protein AAB399_01510 [Patescibacteria group bacterium]
MNALDKKLVQKIKFLRTRGRSIPEISRILMISRSTALRYSNTVSILPAYRRRWLERRNASKIKSQRHLEEAKKNAETKLPNITNKDLVVILSSLYWAEGNKKDLVLTNTDPEMIRTFLYILRRVYNIPNNELRVSLRIYEDLNKKECLRYWSKITGIILNNKTTVSVLIGHKKGKLSYGMCRIRVKRGGRLLKEIFSIINRINLLTKPS